MHPDLSTRSVPSDETTPEPDRTAQPSMFDVEHEVLQETIARAQHTVAEHALDANDCRELLQALGIDKVNAAATDFDWRDTVE